MWSFERLVIASAVFYLIASTLASADQRTNAVMVPRQDQAMTAAFTKAHATLDDFLAKFAHPPAGTVRYAVKIGIEDTASGFAIIKPGGGVKTEYFWVGDLQADGDRFTGFVHNDPEIVRNISLNQQIHFDRDDIADWVYFDRGKMKGNFTACPALVHSPSAMADMHERLGLTCE
jgi:uncharacterized protein YegJ (DUF2314 family)